MPTIPPSGSSQALERVPLYILAGGKSRRFGSDKARFLHDGVPLLVGVANALAPIASETAVVAARGGMYDDLGLRTIGDVVEQAGPMGGLLTAIEDRSRPEWLFLCACDWLGLCSEWAVPLMRECKGRTRAVAYRTDRFEPLFALYHTSIRSEVSDFIAAGNLAMQELLGHLEAVSLEPPANWIQAFNVNRPSQTRQAE